MPRGVDLSQPVARSAASTRRCVLDRVEQVGPTTLARLGPDTEGGAFDAQRGYGRAGEHRRLGRRVGARRWSEPSDNPSREDLERISRWAGVPLPKLAILNPKHDPFLAGTRRLVGLLLVVDAPLCNGGESRLPCCRRCAHRPCSHTRVAASAGDEKRVRASLARRRLRHVGGGIRGAHELLETLVCEQLTDGSWSSAPGLRIPDRTCVAPRAEPYADMLYADPDRLFTSATVLDALSRSTARDDRSHSGEGDL